jgi:DNA-binding PadR family transcriptional regulator
MEGRGWLAAEWGTSENNRRARYYKLTAAGRQRLRTESESWLRYTKSVSSILALAAR